ncbi:DUF1304 domain-containing protein [Loigolactobacillus rennini]|uniref:Integral membrane protein n=1 Tax=Loigolactobacillus rennini DSM 20253 TaxID=1423796 RepID=A0A0R2CS68_9LACO|nr:DUF1304 domain-containing protein [Loigolactobacillus rennini]KRM94638.1 hypothetical protein FC24_GL000201 [Loigolactobacillus rennini DSM 20253]
MSLFAKILIVLVALEFCYIMYLETFVTTSAATSRVFKLSSADLKAKHVNTLLKNQGIYNGLIAVGLLYSVFFATAAMEISRLLLIYIILVALYGSITSDKKIILTQGGLAIVALLTTFL